MSSIQLYRRETRWEIHWNGALQGHLTPATIDPLAVSALIANGTLATTREHFAHLLDHWLSHNRDVRFIKTVRTREGQLVEVEREVNDGVFVLGDEPFLMPDGKPDPRLPGRRRQHFLARGEYEEL